MSDKNRNMNDINDQKTAEQQAFSEEIRRRLAEPGSGKPALDEFKVMVYKDREKRRKKRNALVACIVAAFIVGFLSFDALVPEVGADKNPKETIVTEDVVIIEDGGYGSSEEADNVWVTEDWEQVEDLMKEYPQIIIPKYIPSGYDFKQLSVENYIENGITAEYLFTNKKGENLEIELFLTENDQISVQISDVERELMYNDQIIYIQEDNKKATIQIDGGIVSLWHVFNDKELFKIIKGLK